MKVKDLQADHVVTAHIIGQATAGTADEWVVCRVPFKATVTKVEYIPVSDVTGAATNNFKARCRNRTSAGAGDVEIAGLTFASGVTADDFDAKSITLSTTAADLDVAEGDVLTLEKIVNGTGMAMPEGLCVVHFKAR